MRLTKILAGLTAAIATPAHAEVDAAPRATVVCAGDNPNERNWQFVEPGSYMLSPRLVRMGHLGDGSVCIPTMSGACLAKLQDAPPAITIATAATPALHLYATEKTPGSSSGLRFARCDQGAQSTVAVWLIGDDVRIEVDVSRAP